MNQIFGHALALLGLHARLSPSAPSLRRAFVKLTCSPYGLQCLVAPQPVRITCGFLRLVPAVLTEGPPQ